MEQLAFTGVHEDGQHLVLSSPEGGEFLVPIDARLRAALRTRTTPADTPAAPLSPRDVQAMIRAGQGAEEVAEITGWSAERIARFEGPILAEREYVATMAQAAHVRGRSPDEAHPTLGTRVLERLGKRGVDTDNVGWDATRPEGGGWTVVVSFVAGQRRRAGAWRFDPADRTIEALDDEARWLSEDEQALPGSAAGSALLGAGASEETELVTSMRARSRSRGRRRKPSTSSSDPAGIPQLAQAPEDVLPLEDLAYDPDTMGLPPAAHGAPSASGAAAAPEPARDDPDLAADTERSAAAPQERVGGPAEYDVELEFDTDEPAAEATSRLGAGAPPDSTEEAPADDSPQEATLSDLFSSDEDVPEDEGAATDEPAAKGDEEVPDSATAVDRAPDDPAADNAEPAAGEEESPSGAPGKRPQKKAAKRKDGRPGVPSWDDIMFGAKGRR